MCSRTALQMKRFVDRMARFVEASMKGWAWARANSDAAADIVLEYDDTGAQTEEHQRRMMGEINKLTEGSDGTLDPGRLRAHRRDIALRRFRPGDHDASGRSLDARDYRQGHVARGVCQTGGGADDHRRRVSSGNGAWSARRTAGADFCGSRVAKAGGSRALAQSRSHAELFRNCVNAVARR